MKLTISGIAIVAAIFWSCKKNAVILPVPPAPEDTTTIITPPNNPDWAATIGFFGNEWTEKRFISPSYLSTARPAGTPNATISIDMSHVLTKVSKYLFGNNSNLWMGQVVDQPGLINYLKDLSPNIIRAPAGSVSDVYFFNRQADDQPPDVPDSLYDFNGNKTKASYWYGKNTASWTFSIDNYYQLLLQTNSTGIITVNYAYARYGESPDPIAMAAHLAADWVRYDNGRTKYWEIGNESGGAWEASFKIDNTKNRDGQPEIITGDLYGAQFKIFADSMRAAASVLGKTIYIGAQLTDAEPASWQNNTDRTWNQGVLTQAGGSADFFIIHDYFTAYNTNSPAADILTSATTIPANAMGYVKQQFAKYGIPVKPLALTEWNIQAVGSKQNVSNTAGIHAAITLGEMIKNEFGQASRWDLANGWANGDDQGMFNIGDEPDVVKWNPRPAFYYMYYFQKYFGDRMVNSVVSGDNNILSYASSYTSGECGLVIVNKGVTDKTVSVNLQNFRRGTNYYWHTLSGGSDTEFPGAVTINGTVATGTTGGPLGYASIKARASSVSGGIVISAPGGSVTFIAVENKK